MPAVIFDLDGTLSDDRERWRQHVPLDYGTGHSDEPVNWDLYHMDMADDAPVKEVLFQLESFGRLGYKILILSGRPVRYETITREWLLEHNIRPTALLMRPDSALDSNVEVKRRALKAIKKAHTVAMAFENDERTVAMYREEGVTCMRVML